MKKTKYIAISLSLLSTLAFAQPTLNLFYNVPFTNLEIPAGSKIYALYEFNPQGQTVVCHSDKSGHEIISAKWIYKDVSFKSMLPVVLKGNLKFSGQLADAYGRLAITNEFGPESVFVSCHYEDQ